MMKKINEWALSRLPSRRSHHAVTVSTDGLTIEGGQPQCLPWSAITSIVATRADNLVGASMLLVLTSHDGIAVTITEDDPAWNDLITTLPHVLPRSLPYEQWALDAAFSDPPASVTVLS